MPHITKKDIDNLQRKMEEELSSIINETREEMNPELKENFIDIDGDEAVSDTIIDTNNAIIGIHLNRARELNSALERIHAGIFGVCIECGNNIGSKRLSAYPTAERCIECQSGYERMTAGEPKASF